MKLSTTMLSVATAIGMASASIEVGVDGGQIYVSLYKWTQGGGTQATLELKPQACGEHHVPTR